MGWVGHLGGDPRPWLLEESDPAVRAAALQRLLDRPADDPDVRAARRAAMDVDPIRAILADQHPDGYWVKPGPGYAPKYTGTVWQVMFLDQLGADPDDSRVRGACAYVIEHSQTRAGGFGASGSTKLPPPPSAALHCLTGNLLAALLGLGWAGHRAVDAAIDWSCRAITGAQGFEYYRSGTSGPGFSCVANEHRPCAWGALKQLRALSRVPASRRTDDVEAAIRIGVELMLSVDPVTADYPRITGTAPSGTWFRLGFPMGYSSDVLETLEVLGALGLARDARLDAAVEWLLAQQDRQGRWCNRHSYSGRKTVPFEGRGPASKWVTLRACTALRARFGD